MISKVRAGTRTSPRPVPLPGVKTPCTGRGGTASPVPTPRPRRGLGLPSPSSPSPATPRLSAPARAVHLFPAPSHRAAHLSAGAESFSPQPKAVTGRPAGLEIPRRGKAERCPGAAAAPGAEPIPPRRCFPARRGQHRNIHRHPPPPSPEPRRAGHAGSSPCEGQVRYDLAARGRR